MLLCLTTGKRGQTIHKFDVNYIQEMDEIQNYYMQETETDQTSKTSGTHRFDYLSKR